ncbi:MAG: SAM-dependent methyltransferase [Bacteroidales bacterium]|nr:SAM-dependent methyltransferase [Bacteroidales bacterium]
MSGRIFLIPVTLGSSDFRKTIPEEVICITKSLRNFIVEDIRSARRHLKLIDKDFPVDEALFRELNVNTPDSEISGLLKKVEEGADTGLMSEAGLPGIADPGSRLISLAHERNIEVIPLSGPSSIILALIASGLNGQRFSFNGYLPVNRTEREMKIRDLEKTSRSGYSQIFMETPYRNQQMLESILNTCNNDTMLCIAADVTLPSEFIKTKKISQWKKEIPDIRKRQVIFILQSRH